MVRESVNIDHLEFLELEAMGRFMRMVNEMNALGRWERVDIGKLEKALEAWRDAREEVRRAKEH